ncbi:hypothetical protein EV421DRAFT_1910885 [Armillaria borealis]|uniref:Uncharacterized protein n=1 Tax=Armillaria borealis TaxID=47425 RepID=A0AA39J130_9AGAR|nr:hypothetical protein EV421DRAFT_1910885 [Armillaria borealis]
MDPAVPDWDLAPVHTPVLVSQKATADMPPRQATSSFSAIIFATRVAQSLTLVIGWSPAPSKYHASLLSPIYSLAFILRMLEHSDPPCLPPEILDAIVDELWNDKKSLKQAPLACKSLCLRTRVHLFSAVKLGSVCSDRLRELLTLSPKLALHFKSLEIIAPINDPPEAPTVYGELRIVESLVNITHLSLVMGDWRHMPDTVVASLQSRSYHTLNIGVYFIFRSVGEICSFVKNSPGLQHVDVACIDALTEECSLDHSLHPAPPQSCSGPIICPTPSISLS